MPDPEDPESADMSPKIPDGASGDVKKPLISAETLLSKTGQMEEQMLTLTETGEQQETISLSDVRYFMMDDEVPISSLNAMLLNLLGMKKAGSGVDLQNGLANIEGAAKEMEATGEGIHLLFLDHVFPQGAADGQPAENFIKGLRLLQKGPNASPALKDLRTIVLYSGSMTTEDFVEIQKLAPGFTILHLAKPPGKNAILQATAVNALKLAGIISRAEADEVLEKINTPTDF